MKCENEKKMTRWYNPNFRVVFVVWWNGKGDGVRLKVKVILSDKVL